MTRGHNRPPLPPKVPGTDMRSWDVPTAIIYRPARSVMSVENAGATRFQETSENSRRRRNEH
jgi:hypothetical protein